MKQTVSLSCSLIALVFLCFFIQRDVNKTREDFFKTSYMDYTLPSKFTGVAAMEFKGIVSDFLYLKVATFFGGKFIKKEILGQNHAEYVYNSVDVITDLDPWFWDAYLFSSMMLAWDFGLADKANELLLKARKYRTNDFKPPYYIGFNCFYFLKDKGKASTYIMEASKLPGGSHLFSLGTKLSVYENQLGPAIIFLKELLENTQSPVMEKRISTRLKTLLILDNLEKKVQEYKKIYGIFPKKISDLIKTGFIESIPEDPYGGEFFIVENGRVFTTSKLIQGKKVLGAKP